MSYIITQEHINVNGKFEISASDDNTSFLSTKIQSRHVSAKQYITSVIMVSVIDASKSDEDNVVKETFSCFVVQLVYYKISSNIWVLF